jgi:hypothetical protein
LIKVVQRVVGQPGFRRSVPENPDVMQPREPDVGA